MMQLSNWRIARNLSFALAIIFICVGLVLDFLTYGLHRDYTYRPYWGSLIIIGVILAAISVVSFRKITKLLEKQLKENK